MSALCLHDVTVMRERNKVLRNCSLVVEPGEVAALVGPNGSGKTTTLLACAQLLPVETGAVEILGQVVKGRSREVLRDVGFLPDDPFLYDHLTSVEFFLLCARLRGRMVSEQELASWSERFGLPPAGVKIKECSLGMRRKVGIIAQLVFRPRLVLMDEPFNALDQLAADELRRAIRQLSEQGTAFLITTHRPADLEGVAHRALLLRGRAIVNSGTWAEWRTGSM